MTSYARETPDAIGWHGSASTLIECKTSRSDYLADAKKKRGAGMGFRRYFLVPQGLVMPTEIPDGWGLLEWDGKRVRSTAPAEPRPSYDRNDEIKLLLSALRRVGPSPQGVSVRLYKFETCNRASMGVEVVRAPTMPSVSNAVRLAALELKRATARRPV